MIRIILAAAFALCAQAAVAQVPPDAVKELASKAGMDIPAPDPRAREQAERSASLTDLMGQIAQWYSEQLNGLNGGEAREYLKRRGIDGVVAARFGLGLGSLATDVARRLADDQPRREKVASEHSSEARPSSAVSACPPVRMATCHQTRPNLKPARERPPRGVIRILLLCGARPWG